MSRYPIDDLTRSWTSDVSSTEIGAGFSFQIRDVAAALSETAGPAEATLWLEGVFSCVFLGYLRPDSADRPPPPDAYPPGRIVVVRLDRRRNEPSIVTGGGPIQVGTVLWAGALPHPSFSRTRSLGIQWVARESIRVASVVGRRVARWPFADGPRARWQPYGRAPEST